MKLAKGFLIVLIVSLTSCMTLVKWKYGITGPKEETPVSLLKFLQKMNKSPDNVCLFRDSSSFFRAMNDSLFRKNLLGSMVFSPTGFLLDVKDTSKCQWSVASLIHALGTDKEYVADTSYRFEEFSKGLVFLSGSKFPDSFSIQFDYIVVITWGKFAGKLNQRLFDAEKIETGDFTKKIKLIFLNFDMQKSWNLTKKQKLILR